VLNVFIGFPTADIKFGKTKQEAKIPIAFMNVIQKTTVEVTTVAGTAQENTHFTPMKQTLTLMPGEIHQYVTVPLSGAQEDGMTFSLQLSDAKVETGTTTPTANGGEGGGEAYPLKTNDDASSAAASNQTAEIRRPECKVTITEGIEEQPGMVTFGFDFREIQGKHETHTKPLNMFRVNGASGVVSCKVSTERNTAVAGKDYEEITDEEIFFQDGETRQELMLTILHKNDYEGRENFLLKAHDASNGLEFNPADDGGDECNMQTIYVLPTGKGGGLAKLVMGCCNKVFNCDELTKGMETWAGQYKSALYPGGDYESMQEATSGDMVMHLLSLPWKLLFAAIPPTEFWGGKITFVGALTFIGVMTAVIGDLAASFGCVIDLPDEITAITFVALGTSLPDTFASRTSAMMDDTADASIGNVTGSNSVNVFLGLGLPWTLGALHWEGKGTVFAVPAGNLVFSVIVFVVVALMCFSVLAARRRAFGGELGGPEGPKLLSAIFLTSLWIYYIAMSSWRTLLDKDGVTPSTGEQIGVMVLGFVVLFVVAFALSTLVGMCSAGEPDPAPLEMKDGMVILKVDEARKKYASNVLLELAGKDGIEKTDMMKQVKLMSTALGEMQKFVDGFEDKLRKLTEADDPADTPSKASE
jgi:solute carrier family 8 (sodium/calcium exchanger)